jgi:L-histidine Nalpha-methyltransferase
VAGGGELAAEVRAGLLAPHPFLPSKYFYDARGARLFERITRLPEYYQTRTEERLLNGVADEVIALSRPRELVEIGSGTSRKLVILLDAMRRASRLERCVLFDLNMPALRSSVHRLQADYPSMRATAVAGDFTRDLHRLGSAPARLVAFLGGTIGNLHPGQVASFLAAVAGTLRPGGAVLLGLDLVKDTASLEAAYNDAGGVTAEFNRNLLRVINARLGADFDPEGFDHVAVYDRRRAWIEMRLRARRPMRVRVPRAGLDLSYRKGDELRTEISCKYTRASLEARLGGTGLRLRRFYTDEEELFALALLVRARTPPAPPRPWRGPGGPWGVSRRAMAATNPPQSAACRAPSSPP